MLAWFPCVPGSCREGRRGDLPEDLEGDRVRFFYRVVGRVSLVAHCESMFPVLYMCNSGEDVIVQPSPEPAAPVGGFMLCSAPVRARATLRGKSRAQLSWDWSWTDCSSPPKPDAMHDFVNLLDRRMLRKANASYRTAFLPRTRDRRNKTMILTMR